MPTEIVMLDIGTIVMVRSELCIAWVSALFPNKYTLAGIVDIYLVKEKSVTKIISIICEVPLLFIFKAVRNLHLGLIESMKIGKLKTYSLTLPRNE